MLKFSKFQFGYKKGRSFLLLPFFLFIVSCAGDLSRYGRVTTHNTTTNKNSFVFAVNEQFLAENPNSKTDKKNPKMTEAEAKLLNSLLKQQSYCLNGYGSPVFIVTSRQEKIYDMTFAHLIEQNYNARPVTPRTYFGQCIKE